MQHSTGQTTVHCSSSRRPTHSVQPRASMTNTFPPAQIASFGDANSQTPQSGRNPWRFSSKRGPFPLQRCAADLRSRSLARRPGSVSVLLVDVAVERFSAICGRSGCLGHLSPLRARIGGDSLPRGPSLHVGSEMLLGWPRPGPCLRYEPGSNSLLRRGPSRNLRSPRPFEDSTGADPLFRRAP